MCLQICRAWRRPGLDLGLDVEQVSGCWAEEAVGTARGLMSPSLPRPALPGRDCSCTPGIPSPSHAVPWDLARGGRGAGLRSSGEPALTQADVRPTRLLHRHFSQPVLLQPLPGEAWEPFSLQGCGPPEFGGHSRAVFPLPPVFM